MNGCPITCPCRRGGDGVFLLAACIFAALWSRVFLGGDFGVLVAEVMRPPHHLPVQLAVWASVAVAGLGLLVIGIRALVREGDSAPVRSSLLVLAAGAGALWCGWYLPRAWGPLWSLGSEGFYLAVIAGATANLCLAFGAQVWMAGYVAAGGDNAMPRAVPFDLDEWRNIIERQAQDIERLTGDRAQAVEHARQLEAVLRFPAVRKSVLKALHPDAHAGADDRERRALTERFQKATAVFDRIEGS